MVVDNRNSAEEPWGRIRDTLLDVQNNKLKRNGKKAKQSWMTQNILSLMDQRRMFKNKSEDEYRRPNREIRKRIREAKARWHSRESHEIKDCETRDDLFHLRKKLKEVSGTKRTSSQHKLKDRNGGILIDMEQRLSIRLTKNRRATHER